MIFPEKRCKMDPLIYLNSFIFILKKYTTFYIAQKKGSHTGLIEDEYFFAFVGELSI